MPMLVSTVFKPMKMVFISINQTKLVMQLRWDMLTILLSDTMLVTSLPIHASYCLPLLEQCSCQEDGPCKNISPGTLSFYLTPNKSFSIKLFHSVKLVNILLILRTLKNAELITFQILSCGTTIDSIQT